MELQNKKFVVSYSGGKDSSLAVYRAIQMGMIPQALLTTYNRDMDRSWFHGIPQPLLRKVSEAMGIPIVLIETGQKDYADCFRKVLKAEQEKGAEYCVFGDIDIQGHWDWCTEISESAGLKALFPLWHEDRAALARECVAAGFIANIAYVDTRKLSPKHLGMVLSEPVFQSIAAEGADICGENGEYHSFVSDGPTFRHPVAFRTLDPIQIGHGGILPLEAAD